MLRKTFGVLAAATALASILSASAPATAVEEFDRRLYSISNADSPWVLVNKKRPLNPIKYVPKSLVAPNKFNGGGYKLAKPAAEAFLLLAAAGKKAGVGSITIASGYRSFSEQKAVHANAVAKWGLGPGERLAARPGYSEHQTGLAVDVWEPSQGCRIRVCFATTKAGKWLAKNAWQYGFIIRYPEFASKTTGYQFEPWHLRFVGVELATEMNKTGVTVLERFWHSAAAPSY
ncbi:MAG: hypothetical protein RL510_954 [Actinomycetota bacterium]|jgi:D-alanyl-D-alanine carboxypeptidase